MYPDSCFHGPGALESLHTVTQTRKTQSSREVPAINVSLWRMARSRIVSFCLLEIFFFRSLEEGTLKMCHAKAYEWLKKKKSKGGKNPQTLTKHLLWARSCHTLGRRGDK